MPSYILPAGGFVMGYAAGLMKNYKSGVPLHRGHVVNVLLALGGGVVGYLLEIKLEQRQKEQMFQIQEYVRTHPEDFPQVQRKKWKDVFQPWQSPFRVD